MILSKEIDTYFKNIRGNNRELVLSSKQQDQIISLIKNYEDGKEIGKLSKGQRTRANELITKICQYYCIKKKDFISISRNKEFVVPRRIVMFILYNKMRINISKIGMLLKRDHSSISYNLKTFEFHVANYDDVKMEFINVLNALEYDKGEREYLLLKAGIIV